MGIHNKGSRHSCDVWAYVLISYFFKLAEFSLGQVVPKPPLPSTFNIQELSKEVFG